MLPALASRLLAFGLLGATFAQSAQRPLEVCVIDEAPMDASFAAFRDTLRITIQTRNTAGLLAVVDQNIDLGLNSTRGIQSFQRHYYPENSTAIIWSQMEDILAHGGRLVGDGTFCAPFISCPRLGGLDTLFTFGRDVPVLAMPSSAGEIVTRVSCALLKIDDPDMGPRPSSPGGWIAIVLPNKRWGYVEYKNLRSPADLSAVFRKVRDKWVLAALTAAD